MSGTHPGNVAMHPEHDIVGLLQVNFLINFLFPNVAPVVFFLVVLGNTPGMWAQDGGDAYMFFGFFQCGTGSCCFWLVMLGK